jgi:hypothetical protein
MRSAHPRPEKPARAPSGVWRALVSAANHATHAGNDRRGDRVPSQRTRCECGVPACEGTVGMPRADFDALCATAGRFVVVCERGTRMSARAAGGAVVEELEHEIAPLVRPLKAAA